MRRFVPAAAIAALALLPAVSAGATSLPSLSQVPLVGGLATQALHGATALGAAPAGAPARALVSLRHRDQAGLERFIAQVSDPHSARYGHYLTPAQFTARYAPSAATVAALARYGAGLGLHVAAVPSNRAYVLFTGTVASAERAFGTRIGRFRLRGADVQAPTSPLRLPASLAGEVTAVDGLDTGHFLTPRDTPPAPAYVNAPPFSTAWGDTLDTSDPGFGGIAHLPYVVRGYTPQQLQGAYGVADAIAHGLNGAGQTVAVIDAYSSPTITSDVNTWSARHGLPRANLTVIDTPAERSQPELPAPPADLPIVGGLQDPQGWFGEETLDVEAVHAMAPGARIVMHGANSPQTADLHIAQNDVVANRQAQIISNSYGDPADSTDPTSDGYWQQAAAEGIGVYFASGDDGDQTSGGTDANSRQVDGGGNSPYVTAVGGTTLAVTSQRGYGFETYWGTETATLSGGAWGAPSWNSGAGGGESTVYGEPGYQKGVADGFAGYWRTHSCGVCGTGLGVSTPADSQPVVPGRVVPDVAILADPNSGFLVGQTMDSSAYGNPLGYTLPGDTTGYHEYRIGGTSLASPLFAGVMALADQAARRHHGFANPALYALHSHAGVFHDVVKRPSTVAVVRVNYDNNTNASGGTTRYLRTSDNLGTLESVRGFDDSTGLGTPDGIGFLSALAPHSSQIAEVMRAPGRTPRGGARTGPAVLRTCTARRVRRGGRVVTHHSCHTRTLVGRLALAGLRAAALERGRRILATGAVSGGRLVLRARTPVRRGRYTLVIRRVTGRRTARSTLPVTVR